jgi:hypothetical protein
VRFTLKDKKKWNWFVDASTMRTTRGLLFNIQMTSYLKETLQCHPELNNAFKMSFYKEGFLFFFVF